MEKTPGNVVVQLSKFQAGVLSAFLVFLVTGAVGGGFAMWNTLGRLEVLVEQHEERLDQVVTQREYQLHVSLQAEQYREIKDALVRIENRVNER